MSPVRCLNKLCNGTWHSYIRDGRWFATRCPESLPPPEPDEHEQKEKACQAQTLPLK